MMLWVFCVIWFLGLVRLALFLVLVMLTLMLLGFGLLRRAGVRF